MRGRARPESREINRLERALLHYLSYGYEGVFQHTESATEQVRKLANIARRLVRVLALRNEEYGK